MRRRIAELNERAAVHIHFLADHERAGLAQQRLNCLGDQQAGAGEHAHDERVRLVLEMDRDPYTSNNTVLITQLGRKFKKHIEGFLLGCECPKELDVLHTHFLQRVPNIGLLEEDPRDE